MKNFIIFDNPAVAHELRGAGFAVFKQQYNNKECFAVEDIPEVSALICSMKQVFGVETFAKTHTLHF